MKPYRHNKHTQTHSFQHIEMFRLRFGGFPISSTQGWIHRITSCASIYCLPWEINKSGSRTYENQHCKNCFKEWQPAGSLKSECVLEFSSLKWLLRGLISCRCGLFFGHLLTTSLTDGLLIRKSLFTELPHSKNSQWFLNDPLMCLNLEKE